MRFFKAPKQPIWVSSAESQEAASLAQNSHPPEVYVSKFLIICHTEVWQDLN